MALENINSLGCHDLVPFNLFIDQVQFRRYLLQHQKRFLGLHVEVVQSIGSSGIFGELLAEGVRQIVGRVGGLCVDDAEN